MNNKKPDLNELIINDLYKFLNDENIKMMDFVFNGSDHYKPQEELEQEVKEKLNNKVRELSTTEKRLNLLVKELYGSYEKLDKLKGVSKGTHRAKFKRRLNAWREMLDLLNAKESISTK
jgi:hypothetical protein